MGIGVPSSQVNDTSAELLVPLRMQIELGCRPQMFHIKAIPKRELQSIAEFIASCHARHAEASPRASLATNVSVADKLGLRLIHGMPRQRHKALPINPSAS